MTMMRWVVKSFLVFGMVVGIFSGRWGVGATFEVKRDAATDAYSIWEGDEPVLTYHFGVVPVPDESKVPHFAKGETDFDGAYFTDGSRYGGERSDYIHPLYGFHGEELTVDYPSDHYHHRGLWWSWCEVIRGERLGDLWAVCKIRAYPVEIKEIEATDDHARITAVNDWRFDGETDPIVRETVTIIARPTGNKGAARERTIDVEVVMEALDEPVRISGRQKVDYGGYGGMTIRLNGEIENFRIRAVHPNPAPYNGEEIPIAERVNDPEKWGDRAWMTLFGDFPTPDGGRAETSIQMMESRSTPLYPNPFRYYDTTCSSLAFPAKNYVTLEKGSPLTYRTRVVLTEGITTFDEEKAAFDDYQNDD